ncbi:hypothetical protein [Paenibacillus glacialis]|uniref:Uncharacterized protein n=1 Tax=Paenibacillus glacialis TaxID=494026 RepID=A0A168KH28_9BACL|nr:hypothetical protein [Paenibacillus glacialis]OAB42000.1 hypothetical protein PGLA_14355 [Paenibacillus glacialis]
MAQSKKVIARAKRLQGRPVCITLHSGKTYVGYITGINSTGLTLASAGSQPRISSGKQGPRSKRHRAGSHASGNRSGSRRSDSLKPSSRSRSRKPDAQVSSFLPMMGSLFGAFGGGGLGGALGGGLRLFGMIQRFVPVVKMGYGMVKSIRPFFGSVQGLMKPSVAAEAANESS